MEAIGLACFYCLSSFDDLKTKQIRVLQVIAFAVIGLLIDIFLKPYSLLSILGGVAVGMLVYLFSIISNEKIGKGDAMVVMVSGLYLGFINTVVVLWLASIFAAIFGTIMVSRYGRKLDLEIPFVPFLLFSFLMVFMISQLGGILL